MRILHISDNLRLGGLQSVVVNLANAQTATGHDVSVAAGDGAMWEELDSSVLRIGGHGERFARPWQITKLRRLLRRGMWDIVHSHQRGVSSLISVARIGLTTKHVEHVHNVFLPPTHRFTSFRGQLLVPCGSQVADMLHTIYGRPRSRIREVRNGVADHEARAAPRAGSGPIRVVNVARLTEQKDPERWIDTVQELRGLGVDVNARWVGEGELLDTARDDVRSRGLASVINFSGPERPANPRLGEADLYLSTSRWEGLPLSILEALAAGLPVVATDVGSVRDAVIEGVNGRLLPVDAEPAELAAQIKSIVEAPRVLRAMSAASRELYDREFTFARMVDALDAAYLTLTK